MEFKPKIIITDKVDKNTVYLIPKATENEITRGKYIEINGIKLSKNKSKYGIIINIGVDYDKL